MSYFSVNPILYSCILYIYSDSTIKTSSLLKAIGLSWFVASQVEFHDSYDMKFSEIPTKLKIEPGYVYAEVNPSYTKNAPQSTVNVTMKVWNNILLSRIFNWLVQKKCTTDSKKNPYHTKQWLCETMKI